MGKQRNASGGAASSPFGDTPCRDHGDTRSDWPAAASWVGPSATRGDDGADAACDELLRRQCPTLHEYLVLRGLGGKQRKTGTVLVFAEEGKWKACINDRDGGFYAFVSSDNLPGLLEALERGLKGGGLDWRQSKGKR